jgi:hypothetical protein
MRPLRKGRLRRLPVLSRRCPRGLFPGLPDGTPLERGSVAADFAEKPSRAARKRALLLSLLCSLRSGGYCLLVYAALAISDPLYFWLRDCALSLRHLVWSDRTQTDPGAAHKRNGWAREKSLGKCLWIQGIYWGGAHLAREWPLRCRLRAAQTLGQPGLVDPKPVRWLPGAQERSEGQAGLVLQ